MPRTTVFLARVLGPGNRWHLLVNQDGLPLVRNCTVRQLRMVTAGFSVEDNLDVPHLPSRIYMIAQHRPIRPDHPLLRVTRPVPVAPLRPYMHWQRPRLPDGVVLNEIAMATLTLVAAILGRRGFYRWLIAYSLRGRRVDDPVDCVICRGSSRRTFTWRLRCGHAFHEHCLVAWLAGSNRTCPLCRARV